MDNQRRLIRLEVGDFLEVRALDEVGRYTKGKSANFSLMGVCFSSGVEWKRGEVLLIDYFIPQEMDSVKLKLVVVWSEFIDAENGYFCGGAISEVEQGKEEVFASYYFQRLRERFI